MFGPQRPVAPWADHNWWGQYDTTADLPNVAGARLQITEVQAGDMAFCLSDAALYLCVTPTAGSAVWSPVLVSANNPHSTIHLNIGKLSASTTATTPVGEPDPAALSIFGQATVGYLTQIGYVHLHVIEDLGGGGSMSIEVFTVERDAPNAYTFLGTLSYAGGSGDYYTDTLVPAGVVTMDQSIYLMAQLRTFAAGGGGDGITVDAHFVT